MEFSKKDFPMEKLRTNFDEENEEEISGQVNMSLTSKRRLPDLNNQNNRLSSNREDDFHFSQTTMSSVEKCENNPQKNRKVSSIAEPLDANNFSRHDSIDNEEGRPRIDGLTNKHRSEFQFGNPRRSTGGAQLKTQQNSTDLRESARSIREHVTQFKNDLMRSERSKDDELSSLLIRRRRTTEQDPRQIENEYLIHQQTVLSKSAALNEMLSFKKELEKSERRREQLSEHLESTIKTSDGKDQLLSKTQLELKEMNENCETFERQNIKLQHDLTLALEKLEEMTEEAERFAQESLISQKQLANSEQKRGEFQIQAQETIKQWNARVKKMEKEIERHKLESTQMLEKQEQLSKENETFKSQNSKLQTDLNETTANSKRLDEQFQQSEKNILHLRSIQSSQAKENTTLKGTLNELESQLSIHRQHLAQSEKEKQHLKEILEEEIKQRTTLHSNLKQSEEDIETLHTSHSQLQNERKNLLQNLKEIQLERDSLIDEKKRFLSVQNDYEQIKKKLESTKIDYTHRMKALQMDYESKIETLQSQLSEEKCQNTIFQRHELEHQNEIDRLRERSAKYEDENTRGQCAIEALSREVNDKSGFIDELESKITKLASALTNERNEILEKDNDYQNSLQIVYKDIIYCTECLSNHSNKPFIIEPVTTPRDDIELYSSKLKAHLAWLKQELELRHEQENKLRQELDNAFSECETDRQHFASELAKREVIIDQLTNNHSNYEREYPDTITEYDKHRSFIENGNDRFDQRYRQFQTMIDSVKREFHTAKAQLLI